MSINVSAFIASLRFMAEGWLGIFVVIGVIIACIYGLNGLSDWLEARGGKTPKNSA